MSGYVRYVGEVTKMQQDFYRPDLGANPDDPFARDADGRLVRRAFWLDMSDRSLAATTEAMLSNAILTF